MLPPHLSQELQRAQQYTNQLETVDNTSQNETQMLDAQQENRMDLCQLQQRFPQQNDIDKTTRVDCTEAARAVPVDLLMECPTFIVSARRQQIHSARVLPQIDTIS